MLHSCHANATPQAPPNWTRQVNTSPQHLVASDFSLMPEEPCRPVWELCSSVLTAGASRCQGVHRGFIDRTHGTLPRFEKHLTLAKTLEDSMRMLGLADLATTGVLCSCHEIHNAYHRYHSLELFGFKKTPSSMLGVLDHSVINQMVT